MKFPAIKAITDYIEANLRGWGFPWE